MMRGVIVALRADERMTLCGPVDAATLRLVGVPIAVPAQAGLEGAADVVERTRWHARRDDVDVAALALALPGGGAWRDWGRALAARFDLPASSLPIAQAAVRGEQLHGAAAGGNALLFDTDGLRTGLLLNGRPYQGAASAAGDVAHLGMDRTGHIRCRCGRLGCLAALVHAGGEAPAPPIPTASWPLPSLRHGWLAVAVIALLNIVNPQILLLEGSASETESDFAWLAGTVRLGCLAPIRAGLATVARARIDSALLGTAAFAVAQQARTTLETVDRGPCDANQNAGDDR